LLDKKRAEIVKLHNVLGLYPKERIIKWKLKLNVLRADNQMLLYM
jgi:hypothetical protein